MKAVAWFRKRFAETSFMRPVLQLAGGTSIGQGAFLLAMPIISRLYTPGEMGLFGLFMAFVGIVGGTLSLRYELSVVAAKNAEDAAYLLLGAFLLVVPMALLSSVLLLTLVSYGILSYETLPKNSIPTCFCVLIVTGLFNAARYASLQTQNFSGLGKVLSLQGISRSIVTVFTGLLGYGWLGLAIGDAAGKSHGLLSLISQALPTLKTSLEKFSLTRLVTLLSRNWEFPVFLVPSQILNTAALSLPVPLIAHFFDASAAGLFFIAQRNALLPSVFVGKSIADVYHSRSSKLLTESPELVMEFTVATAKRLFKLGCVTMIPALALAPLAIGPILGSEWTEAGYIMLSITPWPIANLVVSPVSRILLLVKDKHFKLWYDISSLLGVVAVIGGGATFLKLSLLQTLALLGLVQTLNYLLLWHLCLRAIKRVTRLNNVVDPASSTLSSKDKENPIE